MKRILFVCTGNTCRSPMAEALLRNLSDFEVKSAGVYASAGQPVSPHTLQVLQEQNIPLQHNSKPVTKELITWSDLILTMTANHKQALVDKFPIAADKAFTLKNYIDNETGNEDIIDPFGGSIDMYRQTFLELEQAMKLLLPKLAGDRFLQ